MPTSSPGQRDRAMPAGVDEEVNQNTNRNSNRVGRRSSSPQGRFYSYVSTNSYYPGRPVNTPAEQERLLNCVTLFTIWLLMITAGFFLVYYVYSLEWDPVMSDSISVFGLGLAVTILYITFVLDICVGILVLISRQDYAKPHNSLIFMIALIILCVNLVHGIFIWLWVWTGEYPRTCAKNTFYYGKHCVDIEMIMISNKDSDGTLSLGTCKCDYGQCLPECKGLREVQHYFWGTYWLFFLRLVVLVMLLRPLRQACCECQWCCCRNPARVEEGRITRVSQAQHTTESGTYAKEGYNGSSKVMPSNENNNDGITGEDKIKMNSTDIGTNGRYDFTDYNQYSENGTYTGTTIKGNGTGQQWECVRVPEPIKKTYALECTRAPVTIKKTYASESECTRAQEPIKKAYASECATMPEPIKKTYDFTEYKRNSRNGTRSTKRKTAPSPDSECTMTTNQTETSAYTDHARDSENGTCTETPIKESKKTGDGYDTVITIVPKREIIHSRPDPEDSAGKKAPVGKVSHGTGESMHVNMNT